MTITRKLLLTALALAMAPSVASADDDRIEVARSRASWPTEAWQTARPDLVDLESDVCQRSLAFAGLAEHPEVDTHLNTDGLVIVKSGQIIFSDYARSYSADRTHPMWSSSKSLTSAIVGAAIQAGIRTPDGELLSLESTLASVVPDRPYGFDPLNGQAYEQITVASILDMGTAIDWSESYDAGVLGSNVLEMLYISGFSDMSGYVRSQPFVGHAPGTIYNYSSGNVSLIMEMLKDSYEAAGEDYDRMPWTLLFDRIGITHAAFEQDGAGVFVGSSYAFMTTEEMAKVGFLYLNDGCWGVPESQVGDGPGQLEACAPPNGDGTQLARILADGWVDRTRSPNPSYLDDNTVVTDIVEDGVYGMTWWLNQPAKGFAEPSYPDIPYDMFAALGHYGQLIIVIPSLDMVIARTGADLEYNSKLNELVSGLLGCFGDVEVQ